MAEPIIPPADADNGNETPPVAANAGQGDNNSQAPLQIPEKFKGKSAEDIAKAYIELEGKLGEQSASVEEAKKAQEQVDTLLRAIYSDPDTYRTVEQAVQKYTNGGVLPDNRNNPNKKGDEEAQADKTVVTDPKVDELKKTEENRILGDFFGKYGYNNLPEKERKDNYQKLSLALAELVDPGGNRPIAQILSSIPTSKLSTYLENAHFIANKDMMLEQAKKSALITERENNSATIGSFSAASTSGQEPSMANLTSKEREMAGKMGISEEQYAKRKFQIQKEASSFS